MSKENDAVRYLECNTSTLSMSMTILTSSSSPYLAVNTIYVNDNSDIIVFTLSGGSRMRREGKEREVERRVPNRFAACAEVHRLRPSSQQ